MRDNDARSAAQIVADALNRIGEAGGPVGREADRMLDAMIGGPVGLDTEDPLEHVDALSHAEALDDFDECATCPGIRRLREAPGV